MEDGTARTIHPDRPGTSRRIAFTERAVAAARGDRVLASCRVHRHTEVIFLTSEEWRTMRTTLTLDEDVADFLRAQSRLHDKPFKQVVNEVLPARHGARTPSAGTAEIPGCSQSQRARPRCRSAEAEPAQRSTGGGGLCRGERTVIVPDTNLLVMRTTRARRTTRRPGAGGKVWSTVRRESACRGSSRPGSYG